MDAFSQALPFAPRHVVAAVRKVRWLEGNRRKMCLVCVLVSITPYASRSGYCHQACLSLIHVAAPHRDLQDVQQLAAWSAANPSGAADFIALPRTRNAADVLSCKGFLERCAGIAPCALPCPFWKSLQPLRAHHKCPVVGPFSSYLFCSPNASVSLS